MFVNVCYDLLLSFFKEIEIYVFNMMDWFVGGLIIVIIFVMVWGLGYFG